MSLDINNRASTSPSNRSSSLTPNENEMDLDPMQQQQQHSQTDTSADRLQPSSEPYASLTARRKQLLHSVAPLSAAQANYEPLLSVPHSCSVNALAVTPCANHFFTGGQDGIIRRYALVDSLNGKPVENLMVAGRPNPYPQGHPLHNTQAAQLQQQMTASSGAAMNHIQLSRSQAQVLLAGYWENAPDPEEANASTSTEEDGSSADKIRFGPRSFSFGDGASPVHSLVVQDEEMFALAGSENGSINLYTVRLDEGRLRHSWAPSNDSKNAHKPKPISSIALNHDQTGFVSGGFDAKIMQWDLNTGNLQRDYAAGSHVTSLSFRPVETTAYHNNSGDSSQLSSQQNDTVSTEESDAEDIEAALKPRKSLEPPIDKLPPTPSPLQTFADALNPSLPELSSDVLLCSSLDGQVTLYDRRAEQAAMRKFSLPHGVPPWAMSATWSADGNSVYVGRRDASIDTFDLRAGSKKPRHSVRFPSASGPVSAVYAHPDNRHVVCASTDNVRIVDLEWDHLPASARRPVPYRIVPGHSNGTISSLAMEPRGQYLLAAAGHRNMIESPTGTADGVVMHALT